MMPKHSPTPAIQQADLLAEVLAFRPEVERILQRDSRANDSACLEDQMQVVLLNVTRHLNDYQAHVDGMRPWVARIAQNVQRDNARRERRRRRAFGYQTVAPDDVFDDAGCPERRAGARALLCKVVEAMGHMPEQLRAVLVLVAFGRLDHEQVATELTITVPAVKMRLLRAREYLREHAGTLDDHLAILAPIPVVDPDQTRSWPRRALNVGSQFVHLWPALLASALSLSQFHEQPISASLSPISNMRNDEQPPKPASTGIDAAFSSRVGSTATTTRPSNPDIPKRVVSGKSGSNRAATPSKAPIIEIDTTDSFRGGGSPAPDSSP